MTASIEVLVVDEDPDVLDVTAAFLERAEERLSVTTERRTTDALEHFEANGFDAVVSDYRMPGMDGLEFFEAIRDRDGDVPFFLLTADVEEDTRTAAESAGVTGFITKDVGTEHYDDLATAILRAVDA
ncbi:response regulator [Halobacteriales archaeon Cl-PHB]